MLSMTSITPTACSEHELLAAARTGDDRAFEELYARYRDRIGGFIRSRVGDYGRAEDVGQEVFISALRRVRASDRPVQFKPWIYEIAKNACIDEYRRTQRAREVSLDLDEEAGGPRPLLSLAPRLLLPRKPSSGSMICAPPLAASRTATTSCSSSASSRDSPTMRSALAPACHDRWWRALSSAPGASSPRSTTNSPAVAAASMSRARSRTVAR